MEKNDGNKIEWEEASGNESNHEWFIVCLNFALITSERVTWQHFCEYAGEILLAHSVKHEHWASEENNKNQIRERQTNGSENFLKWWKVKYGCLS